ncbi:MAG: AAA family ATPase [Bdellovibrionales bacterium]|nr:AAA family ATPase [Bdellovibrionales bacterium]
MTNTQNVTDHTVIGHAKEIQALATAALHNRLHHTLLFSGPDGVGKRLVARSLAQLLLCQIPVTEMKRDRNSLEGCGKCQQCSLLRAGNMPDYIEVNCEDKASSSAEGIRELLKTLRLRPFYGEKRVVLFDNAHALHGQSANALLKALEEPRAGTFFILVTSQPQLVISTIHSRSQRWGFHVLNGDELSQVIQRAESIPVDEKLLTFADGSLHRYMLILHNRERLLSLQEQLKKIALGSERTALLLGEELAQEKGELKDILLLLSIVSRHHLKRASLPSEQARWSMFLDDLVGLPYFLLRRNLAPLYLFQSLFLRLASPNPESFLIDPELFSIDSQVAL